MAYVEGLRAIVTGAGSGIGAALARRLAAAGARVVVNDLDADRAQDVAASIGGFAAPGDAAGDEGAAALVRAAREAFGGVDLFCANAGVAAGGGPEAPDADWELSWRGKRPARPHPAGGVRRAGGAAPRAGRGRARGRRGARGALARGRPLPAPAAPAGSPLPRGPRR